MNVTRRDVLVSSAALAAIAALPRGSRAATRRSDPKRVLILGGTGFIGPHIVASCKAQGWQVTLFNRGKTRPDLFKGDEDVETLIGDRDGNLKSLEDAIKSGRTWQAVVDDAGFKPRIVKASAQLLAPAVEQYVFISTVSVYSDLATPNQDESGALGTIPDDVPAADRENVNQWYGPLKVLCEKEAEAACPGKTASLRPGLIVGPGDTTDRFAYWPVRFARGGEVLCPGDGSDPLLYIDVRDLADFVARCIADRTMGTYNVIGPEKPLPTRELMAACDAAAAEVVKDRPKTTLTWVPADFLEAQGVGAWQDLPLWVPGSGDSGGMHTMKNTRGVAKGLKFRDPKVTARDTITFWNSLPEERRAKPRWTMTPEREATVLAAFHAKGATPEPAGKSGG